MILGNQIIGMVDLQLKKLQSIMVIIQPLLILLEFIIVFNSALVTIYSLCVTQNILKMEAINIEMF